MSEDYLDELDRICHDWASEEKDGVARFRLVFTPDMIAEVDSVYGQKTSIGLYVDDKPDNESE